MVGLLRAFVSTPGLRTKLALMVLAVALYRLGHNVPGPGVDVRAVRAAAETTVRDDPFVALVDLLTGGGLLRLSVLGLGVFPYLVALLAVQLLTQIHPRTRALAAEGKRGKAWLDRYALILTALVGAVMAAAVVASAAGGHLPGGDVLTSTTLPTLLAMAGCMTAGAVATAGLARMLSTAAFGNGIGLLFFVQVAAGFAGLLADVHEEHGSRVFAATVAVAALSALAVVVAVNLVAQATRRVPIHYQNTHVPLAGARHRADHLPIRVCAVGLFPVRTALVLLFLPALGARLWPGGGRPDGVWTLPQQDSVWFLAALFALVVLLVPVSSLGTFGAGALADQLRRKGAFVPGIRPGRPTAEYLAYVHRRVVACSPLVLAAAAVFPSVVLAPMGSTITGVGVLIVATAGHDVALRIGRVIETRMSVHRYAPFLPDS